ncbi:MAG: isoprenylcysteine carboxylmethyltransferase family protein [Pseudomonadota bacterium]
MSSDKDAPDVVIHPPIALAIAVVAALVLNWLYPLPILSMAMPGIEAGLVLLLAALLIVRWAAVTFRKAHTNILTSQSATAIVSDGPFARSRNPIYVAILLGLIGFALAFNSLWFLAALLPMYFVLRYGVIAREESYLERKFDQLYLDYKTRVRRWF